MRMNSTWANLKQSSLYCSMLCFFCCLLGTALYLLPSHAHAFEAKQPNIILVLVDDMGYGDISAFGSQINKTPNLDELAAEGQAWTNFYSTSSVCSPTRGAIMTGMYPVRSGLYGKRLSVLFPEDEAGIPEDIVTLPEYLKGEGYATALLGKWHLGDQEASFPTNHGFDYWYGIPYSNDMRWNKARRFPELLRLYVSQQTEALQSEFAIRQGQLFAPKSEYWDVPLVRSQVTSTGIRSKVLQNSVDQPLMTQNTTSEAIEFIKQQAGKPFFVQISYAMPHVPLFTSAEFHNKTGNGIYSDVVAELDAEIGKLKDYLVDAVLDKNTLLVFTSDNGPWLTMKDHGGSAGVFRNGKGTTFEGGMRVPTIFWQPGKITPGQVDALGTSMDLFSTFVSYASGKQHPENASIATDSVDLSPVLLGSAKQTREELAFYHKGELRAYRAGHYKAHFITQDEYSLGAKKNLHKPPLLYDLSSDPSESIDLAEKLQQVLTSVVEKKNAHQQTVQVAKPLFDSRLTRKQNSN